MIEAERIQREIDKAWVRHDPERGRIPNEISRRVRAFRRQLTPSAAAITRALDDSRCKDWVVDALCKRAVGRERALAKIRRTLAGASLALGSKTLAVNWLAPSVPVLLAAAADDPGLAQDCVLAHLAVAWVTRRTATFWSQWILEVPDHALGRLLQRSPQADLADCLAEATSAFLDADAEQIVDAAEQNRPIYLRAGAGVFLTEMIKAGAADGSVTLYARARTYLANAMLSDSQMPIGTAADSSNSVLELLLQIALTTWSQADVR